MRPGKGIARGALALALLLPPGCAARDPALDAAEAAARNQALIVAGNQAYRSGKYQLAAKRYAAAAVAKKDDPAAYFGMGMALAKLGRIEEARLAYARSRELARQKPRRPRRLARAATLGRHRRRRECSVTEVMHTPCGSSRPLAALLLLDVSSDTTSSSRLASGRDSSARSCT